MTQDFEARKIDWLIDDLIEIHYKLGYLKGCFSRMELLQADMDKLKERLDTLEGKAK
jgi:hypothetical protein